MSPINLMKADLDMSNLAKYGAEQRHSDPDRTAHCLLAESFGKESMPKPFVIKTRQENGHLLGSILAYTPLSEHELRAAAEVNQKLAHAAVMSPRSIATVNVGSNWEKGQTLLFEVRVRPTKRSSSRDVKNPGSEQDIYLGAPPDMTRAEAYCQWVSNLLLKQGCLQTEPDSMAMVQFANRRVRRQNSSRWIFGPDATITGAATVIDAVQMMAALSGGIGRHKGYGYGMLLVR